jgi:thiol:disulfide interchange protein DsbD
MVKRANKMIFGAGIVIAFLLAVFAFAQDAPPSQIIQVQGLTSLDKVYPGSSFELAVVVDIAPGWHINSHNPLDEFLVPSEVVFDEKEGITFGEVIYPEPILQKLAFSENDLSVYEGRIVFGMRAALDSGFPLGAAILSGRLLYQACSDQSCLPPAEVSFEIPVQVVGLSEPVNAINREIFSQIDFGSTEAPVPEQGELGQFIQERGMIVSFFFIFLGGLALNLTPCIYPLIPITVSYFGGQSQGKSGKTFVLALFYVLGIATTYSVLGVIAASTGSVLGAALQNPLALIFVAGVLVALALSMFGLYEIRLPSFLARFGGTGKKGYGGALFMGLTVGIVAAPCIGPFVLGLLTYVAAIGNPFLGFWMFFTLALGLGVPFLVLGTFSGSINRLPRSGVWMVWVKKIFGLILIGMAVYFLRTLIPEALYRFLLPVLALIAGVYLGWIEKSQAVTKAFRWIRNTAGVLFVALSIWLFIPKAEAETIQWQPYSEEFLTEAYQAGKPVIIDFTADWCLPCKELDKDTFSDPEVIKLSQSFIRIKADLTMSEDSSVRNLREKFGIVGVPTVVFIAPEGEEIKELRVTGFIEAGEFLERMKNVTGQQTASKVEPPRTADESFHFEIESPAFPSGKGPVVLIDEAHNNFHSATGTYKPFAALLKKDGYVVKRAKTKITIDILQSSAIFVIADAQPPKKRGDPPTFSQKEIDILNSWVRGGGSLFLITDHMPDPAAIKELAVSFGIEVNNGYVLNRYFSGGERPLVFKKSDGSLSDHPVTTGRNPSEKVQSIATFTGSAFKAGPNFQPIMVFGPNRRSWMPKELQKFPPDTPSISVAGWYQGAVSEFGKGRIAFFSEAAMFTAQVFNQGKVRFGMNHPLAKDNAQLLLNVMHWLSGLLHS